MESNKKLIIILMSASLLVPLTILCLSLRIGFFDIKLGIALMMAFIMLPLTAAGVYMWVTGKGQWAISGYNTMTKDRQAYYDSEKLAKDTGKFLVIISLICMLLGVTGYFPNGMLFISAVIGLMVAAIIGYVVYQGNGKRYIKDQMMVPPPSSKEDRKVVWAIGGISLITSAIILVVVFLFIGSGSIDASMDDERLHVDGPMANKYLYYENIVSVELRNDVDLGSRTGGFGGTKILSGNFNNNEFGDYILACYKDIRTYIVVEPTEGKTVVFNRSSIEETADFYNELMKKLREA